MLSHYKASLTRLGDPVARALLRAHVRPNHLTMVGLGVSILAACALAQGQLRVGAVLLALAGLFDFFDGSLARLANSVSAFGAFLDSVVDRYSDLVVLLGVVLYYHRATDTTGVFLTMVALVGTIMTSYTKARAQSIGVACEIGLIERPERLIVLIAGATFNVLTPAMIALAVLTNLTALQRILYMRRAAADAGADPPLTGVARPARGLAGTLAGMRRLTAAACLVSVVLVGAAPAGLSPDLRERFAAGLAAHKAGDWAGGEPGVRRSRRGPEPTSRTTRCSSRPRASSARGTWSRRGRWPPRPPTARPRAGSRPPP